MINLSFILFIIILFIFLILFSFFSLTHFFDFIHIHILDNVTLPEFI